MQGYRELKIWQNGVEISKSVYRLTASFPKHEVYGLASQMQRAAVSVPSNIAEGHSRSSTKDLIRFVNMSRGSLAELETQLIIASELGYGDASQIMQLMKMTDEESRMLSGYRSSLKRKL
ncbi:MAG: four helix bundle protein [Pirellulales bacterium]|nr:four helix bundle protein [Pirellulales bacterium]